MEDRKQEINNIMNLINSILNNCNLTLTVRERNGIHFPAIVDEINKTEYAVYMNTKEKKEKWLK